MIIVRLVIRDKCYENSISQIPIVWGMVKVLAQGTGRALMQVNSYLEFLCLLWLHYSNTITFNSYTARSF